MLKRNDAVSRRTVNVALASSRVWIRVLLSGFVIQTLTRVKSVLYSGSVSYLKLQVFLQPSPSVKSHGWEEVGRLEQKAKGMWAAFTIWGINQFSTAQRLS